MLSESLRKYRYLWPGTALNEASGWRPGARGGWLARPMPEPADQLARDSRWPALFPSPVALVTAGDRGCGVLERVVGACIVNRFPYTVMLSLCRQNLSPRHHARARFMEVLESTGAAAVQFLPPGEALDAALGAIAAGDDGQSDRRIGRSGLEVRAGASVGAPVFRKAHLVYEARLVGPGTDYDGQPIHPKPWRDVGSHRAYFLEITAIQLRQDIAEGRTQIHWRGLPDWIGRTPETGPGTAPAPLAPGPTGAGYWKPYSPHYRFPAAGTVAFEADDRQDGMAVRRLPPEPARQVQPDNDRARWPCFFPAPLVMITSRTDTGRPNAMPCGSAAVVSRSPLVVACGVSYAPINVRYAPRATLDIVRRSGRFGCAVPFLSDAVVAAIIYCGNVSVRTDPDKLSRAGLAADEDEDPPVLSDLPIHFACRLTGEVPLGTHALLLGQVEEIRVRADVSPAAALEWCPWADVRTAP